MLSPSKERNRKDRFVTVETKLLSAFHLRSDIENIRLAADVVRAGGLVALPTETVYGIGADGLNPTAVAKIFAAKGRPQDNPLILHIASMEDFAGLVREIPQSAHALARAFWPGPLTMVLPKSGAVPGIVSAGLGTVAVRMPAHPVARELIRLARTPIAAPSANISGGPSPTTAAHCLRDLAGRVEIILDGGACEVGLESTVVSLVGGVPRLLRPGAVTLGDLREVLGEVLADPAVTGMADTAQVPSPGMKYRHYAPRAEVILLHGSSAQFAAYVAQRAEPGVFALCFNGEAQGLPVPAVSYGEENDYAAQARRLFAALRELDDKNARLVYAHACGCEGLGLAIYNRLLRAAAFKEIYLPESGQY